MSLRSACGKKREAFHRVSSARSFCEKLRQPRSLISGLCAETSSSGPFWRASLRRRKSRSKLAVPRIASLVSGSDSGFATGAAASSGATQFPAQSFVPLTVPTGRHSLDCFGLTFFPTASRGVCSSCIHPVALAATCDHSAHIQPHGNKLCHPAFKFQGDLFAE